MPQRVIDPFSLKSLPFSNGKMKYVKVFMIIGVHAWRHQIDRLIQAT